MDILSWKTNHYNRIEHNVIIKTYPPKKYSNWKKNDSYHAPLGQLLIERKRVARDRRAGFTPNNGSPRVQGAGKKSKIFQKL